MDVTSILGTGMRHRVFLRVFDTISREEKDITASAKSIFKKLFDDVVMLNDSDASLHISKV